MNRRLLRAGAVCLLANLAACRVGPNYRPPMLPKGADAPLVSLDETLESSASPPDAWWRLYEDARLDAFIQEALRANQNLAAAQANFSAARAVVAAPRLTSRGGYGTSAGRGCL